LIGPEERKERSGAVGNQGKRVGKGGIEVRGLKIRKKNLLGGALEGYCFGQRSL